MLCCYNHVFRHASPYSHKLCSVCLVVSNPGGCGGVYLHLLELDCFKGTGKIKKYDPHNGASFAQVRVNLLKQVGHGIVKNNLRAAGSREVNYLSVFKCGERG